VPILFIALVAAGRRLKRKYGVRLGVVYVLFSITLSIYLPLLILTYLGRVGALDAMGGSLGDLSQLLFAAVVLFGAIVFIALLRRFFWEIWFEKKAHAHAPKFLSQLVGLLLFVSAVLFVLTFDYHKDISVLLSASALGGIVLGIALQDLLSNVIAGIALELGKPFTPGDWLVIDGKHAEVIEVNWRSTRLRDNGRHLPPRHPNKHIVGSTITNLTHPNRQHGIRLHVGFDYSTPPQPGEGCAQARRGKRPARPGLAAAEGFPETFWRLGAFEYEIRVLDGGMKANTTTSSTASAPMSGMRRSVPG